MIKIGHTKKTHGLRGGVKATIEEKFYEDFDAAEFLFIEINGKQVPYFIEEVTGGKELIIKFEDIDDIDAARLITSKELFLKEDQIIPAEQRKYSQIGIEYSETQGFAMVSIEGKYIGTISEVMEMPGQIMALVQMDENLEKLIPLNEQFVVEINEAEKQVVIDLPDGLLEL